MQINSQLGGEPHPPIFYYLPAIFFLAVSLILLIRFGPDYALNYITDDAYYYVVIARNILSSGESSFFPGELTNGYHPLWLLYLVIGGKAFGLSLVSLKAMEIFSVFIGFLVFIRFFLFRSFVEVVFYCAILWRLLASFALVSMETSLLFPVTVFFFVSLLSNEPIISTRRSVFLFLASGLVIGTRLDAVFFVLPLLAVSPLTIRQKYQIFLALFATALAYAILNYQIFGVAYPISGAVKSMGGLQLNNGYLDQMLHSFNLASLLNFQYIILPFALASFVLFVAIWLKLKKRGAFLISVLTALLVGFFLYEAKLIFTSSWRIWSWYGYPQLVLALPLMWLAIGMAKTRIKQVAMISLALFLIVPFFQGVAAPAQARGYIRVTTAFLEKYKNLLDRKNLAMGDRAGQFAYMHNGSVFQLEGLVSSVQYFEELNKEGDLRAYLCARNIEIVIDYGPPDIVYESLDLEIFDSTLTSAKASTIRMFYAEEIIRYSGLNILGHRNFSNNTIYAWRLTCPEK